MAPFASTELTTTNSPTHASPRRAPVGATILGIVLLLVVSASVTAIAQSSAMPAVVGAPHAAIAVHPTPAPKSVAPPIGSPPTAPAPYFFTNTSANPSTFTASSPCYNYTVSVYGGCDPAAVQPSLLSLQNGTLGLVYAVGTTDTNNVCGGLPNGQGASRIAFTNSTDGGATWASGTLIGQTSASCPYFQQFEPSFTTNSSDGIVGAYVGANVTSNGLDAPARALCCLSAALYSNYTNRSSDALIFSSSSDQGATFNEQILTGAGANIADPKVAAFGNTIYIVYENISNASSSLTQVLPGNFPYAPSPNYAISVWMIDSTNGGVTWNAPIALPGENATEFNTSMSPNIAVSATGEVAVTYLTDRSCIAYCSSSATLTEYGDDVVVVTSTTNGSTWSPIHTVFSGTGEAVTPGYGSYGINSLFGYNEQYFNLFQFAPAPVLAFNTTGDQLYIAWSGSYNTSSPETMFGYNWDWGFPTIYAGTASASSNGASWTISQLATVGVYNTTVYPGYTFPSWDMDPGIAVDDGTVYVSYYYQNTTESYYATGGPTCGYTLGTGGLTADAVEYLAESPNGLTWTNTSQLDFRGVQGGYETEPGADIGSTSSILIVNNTPISAYSFPTSAETCTFSGIYEYCGYPGDLHVAIPYSGPTTNATFLPQAPLALGVVQYFGVDRVTYSMGNAGLTVVGLPVGYSVEVNASAPGVPPAGFVIVPTGGGAYTFFGPTNVTLGTSLYTFVNITAAPIPGYFEWEENSAQYGVDEYGELFQDYDYITHAWYDYEYATCFTQDGLSALIPANENVTIGFFNYSAMIVLYTDSINFPPSDVVGEGPGNYTGTSGNFTINASGPLNETVYFYPVGEYTIQVAAPTLPSSTPFQFDWSGQPEISPTGAAVTLANISTGYYEVTNATATSSSPGWIYAGQPSTGNPIDVPETTVVDLSFAYVDVGASTGTVTFDAPSLTAGTVWQIDFNGTVYSSSTPTLTVTTHPGTYPVSGFPVTSENGSVTYAPDNFGPTLSVVAGGTYDVNYTPAYEVTALASNGGTITEQGSHWVANGTVEQFTATPLTGYVWVGWTGSGAGSYSGSNLTASVTALGPVVETANFAPIAGNHYTLTVQQTGVPTGTYWSILLDGNGYGSNGSSIVIPNLYGCGGPPGQSTYTLSVPDAYGGGDSNLTRYVPGSYPTSFCLPKTVSITFSTQYYLTVEAGTGGSAQAAIGGGGFGGSTWVAALATVALKESANSGYQFSGWVGSGVSNYTGPDTLPNFAIAGAITETATFTQLPPPPGPSTYTEIFELATPFAAGTSWTVTINGTVFASTGSELNATGLLGNSYPVTVGTAYSPDHLIQYTPTTSSFTLPVHANGTKSLSYAIAYWVSLTSSGVGSVVATPSGTGFHASGSALDLIAIPGVGDQFLGWTGSGTGSYTGASSFENFTVNAPFTETASFAPVNVGPKTTSTSSPWNSLGAEAGLAIAGLLVGVVVGLVLARGRTKPPMTETTTTTYETTPPPPPGEAGGSP
jgi:hypothetical protein